MNRNSWLDEVQRNLSDLIARSPAADLQRNAKAMMSDAFSRMDLVTREEFDVQVELLARTRVKLDALEAQLRRLEGQDIAHSASTASSTTTPAAAMGAFAQPAAASAATTPSAGSAPTSASSAPSSASGSSSTSTPAGIPSGAGSSGATTPPAGNTGTAPVSSPSSSPSSGAMPASNPPKEGDLAM